MENLDQLGAVRKLMSELFFFGGEGGGGIFVFSPCVCKDENMKFFSLKVHNLSPQ